MSKFDFTTFPVLTTPRLVLRKLTEQDTDAIQALRSNEQVNTYLNRKGPVSKQQALDFIHKVVSNTDKGESVYWCIELQDSPQLVGTICLWNFNHLKKMVDIGYELLLDFQGKGLMQEAMQAVLKYAFDVLKLETITALSHKDNAKSIHLLLKNHFLADQRQQYVSKTEAGGLAVYYLKRNTG